MQSDRTAAATPPRPRRRPMKRADALEQVAATAGALAVALDSHPLQPAAATFHGNLKTALDNLAGARSRGPATDGERQALPADAKDARGYKRAAATRPGYHAGRTPRNKGRLYPPDPPTVAEIVALMRGCPDTPHGHRLRALIPFLWRSGLRISEALAVFEGDLKPVDGSIVVRRGKGGKRRIVGMDSFGWEQLAPWLEERRQYAHGPVFCVLTGPTAGRAWAYSDVAKQLRQLGKDCGIRRRIAAHQFRHALAVDIVREGGRLDLLQRQLGHSDLSITTTYLASVSAEEVVDMAQHRRAPTLAVPDLLGVLHA